MKRMLLLISVFYFGMPGSNAQSGKPDPVFGEYGIVRTDLGDPFDNTGQGRQVLLDSNGRIYILLNFPVTRITRRLPDGSPDPAFGVNGFSHSFSFNESFAAFQPDGKIVIVGSDAVSGAGVVRINSSGTTDSTFGNNGMITPSFVPRSVAVQGDGKIIVTGGSDEGFTVARYNPDGSADKTFNKTGIAITDFEYKVPSDTRDGDDSDILHSGTANTIMIQADGKIIVGGAANTTENPDNSSFAIARYNTNGTADSSFDGDGKRTIKFIAAADDVGYSLALQNTGKIVLAGYSINHIQAGITSQFAIVRFNSNGSPDTSFNGTGKKTVNIGADVQVGNSVAVQSNGKIIIAGYTAKGVHNGVNDDDFAVVRLNANGNLDKAFDGDGILTTDFASSSDFAGSAAIQRNNKIIVVGYSVRPSLDEHLAASRYNPDGSLDNSFGEGGRLLSASKQGFTAFNTSAVQADGKIVAAGRTWNGNNYDFAFMRYNTDGSADDTFSKDGELLTDLGSDEFDPHLIIQNNGKIVAAGTTGFNNSGVALLRYTFNGALDSSFNGNGKLITNFGSSNAVANAVAVDSSGKILVAATILDDDANSVFLIARYKSNGSIDGEFGSNGIKMISQDQFPFICQAMATQADGKIVVAGFTTRDAAIIRFTYAGNFDNTFDDDGIQTVDFGLPDESANSIAIQRDGKIVIGGGRRGSSDAAFIARYNVNGTLDTAFKGNGNLVKPLGSIVSIALQDNGRILAAGASKFIIFRYNTDGSQDISFGDNGVQITNIGSVGSSSVGSIAVSGNKLYAAGFGEFPGSLGVVVKYLLNDEPPIPPTVHLIAPVDGATFLSGGNIYITAAALDADGTVSKVEFYNGSNLLFTATDTPYTFKWEHVHRGNYILIAKATDNSGFVTASDPVQISVVPNTSPTVNIVNPANNQTFLKGATVHLEAIATDPDGRVTRVEFYSDTTLLTIERKAPYTLDWKPAKSGKYTLTARAVDNWNGATTSPPVTISVVPNKAPGVSLISPADGERFVAPATINLRAFAADPDGRITNVKFYNGTTLLSTDLRSPYTYRWREVPAGTYTITAVARDNWGEETTSAPLTIIVTSSDTSALAFNRSSVPLTTGNEVSLQLAPSPAQSILNIYTTGLLAEKPSLISVISASGVIMKVIHINSSTRVAQLNISSLVTGTYIVKVSSGNKVVYRRFVKM